MSQKATPCQRSPDMFAISNHDPACETQTNKVCAASQSARSARIRKTVCWIFIGITIALIIPHQQAFASGASGSTGSSGTIWTQFSNVMKDIYGKLLGVSTIIAVTSATIALLVRMISRNQRAVDEATTWLKRITVTWIILNTMGFIIAYLQPWISGGQYTP